MIRMGPLALVVLLVSSLASITLAQEPSQREVTLPGAGITLGGLLFQPAAGDRPLPAMILLHGWGPQGTPGAPRMAGSARILAARGYVALSLSMRGWPNSGGQDDCGLRQPDDVVSALEWLATQPGVDPDRMGVLGISQGGQVALLTAVRTKRTKAVVAIASVTDVDRWGQTTTFEGIPGYIRSVCQPTTVRSPVHAATRIEAPVLLIHGTRDTRVPTEQSLLMRDALRNANKEVVLHLVPGAEHGFTAEQWNQTWPVILDFLTRTLGGR